MRLIWRESEWLHSQLDPKRMRFKLDENLPLECAELLREAGHDSRTVQGQGLSGAEDSVIAQACADETRVLLTLDLDFGDIRAFPPSEHPGIVVLRPISSDRMAVQKLIQRLIVFLEGESPEGRLWIVHSDKVRIRE